MKFASFCKKYMPYIHTVNYNGQMWAHSGNVYMLLAEGAGTIGTVTKSDPVISDIFEIGLWAGRKANLACAFLPDADGKASDIVRQFSNGARTVNIKNEHFGLIEKRDMCVICTWTDEDENDHAALLIGGPVSDLSEFEPFGIILEMEE